MRLLRWCLVGVFVLGGWLRPDQGALRTTHAAAPAGPPEPVYDGAPIGTAISTTVAVDNTGHAAGTALLYEALPAPDLAAQAVLAPLRVPLPAGPGPIEPDLQQALQAAPDGRAEMVVYLSDQADLSAAAAITDWNARGEAVVAALQAQAAASQPPLLTALAAAGYAPEPYWIVNAVAVRGDAGLAQWLAARPEVALVAADHTHTLEVDEAQAAADGEAAPAWGVSQVRAPSVWADWGVRGAGIVVANIDTGVAVSHSALLTAYRGWSPGGLSHDYNWLDAAGEPPSPTPVDQLGHGTHTLGSLLGGAAGGYSALGVAPAAQWIAVRACVNIFCNDSDLLQAAQWLLAPTDSQGLYPRPDLRPHIISNSWAKPGSDEWFLGYVTAWNAAGIFSAFASGNSGAVNYCGSAGAPANYAASYAVGATNAQDEIANFSSRGPTADGRIKPDLSAPGVSVPSAWPDGSVHLLSGTSMATPHVAGVAALLWSANPTLIGDVAGTQAILNQTARPRLTAECGDGSPAVPNNVYGWGRVDARSAVEAARVDVPWLTLPPTVTLPANAVYKFQVALDARQVAAPGAYTARILVSEGGRLIPIPVTFEVLPAAGTALLTGSLSDAWNSQPVYGRVQFAPGPLVTTDLGGHFTATLPLGDYALTASARGHFSMTASLPFSAGLDLPLALVPDLPRLEASPPPLSATLAFAARQNTPIPLHNSGTQPLSVTVSVPADEWTVTAAGVPSPPLYDLSATQPLSLTDDQVYAQPLALGFSVPINGAQAAQLYLSSNGWVSLSQASSPASGADCLPTGALAPGTLAGFWADLDPSQGGAVRAAAVDAATFVVSYEAVPLWQETTSPPPPTYTFQIVLHAVGDIEFLYGAMGALPNRWGVGMAYDLGRGQTLACYKAPVELAHTRWQVRNQPLPSLWLQPQSAAFTIAPGETATLTARLSGFGYAAWHPDPLVGHLLLTTNDPARPTVTISATVSVAAPPHTFSLPLIHRK
ncbi:MAG: S8 family serine peptidase [Anaerolineales bacterium]|nr:S8 family serine peptidase [Anaerolineales bacterium]